MKVTVKMKHLVWTIGTVAILAVFSSLFLVPKLESVFLNKQVASGNVADAKEAIMKKIESGGGNRFELIRDYMIGPQQIGRGFDVYIGPSMSTYGSSTSGRFFSLEESEPYLRMYVREAPADDYVQRATEILVSYYESTKELEKAYQLIEDVSPRFSGDSYRKHHLQLLAIQVAVKSKETERAGSLIRALKEELEDSQSDIPLLLAKQEATLFMQEERFKEAYELVSTVMSDMEQWHEEVISEMKDDEGFVDGFSGSPYYHELAKLQEQLEQMLQHGHMLGKVTGSVVRANGDPVAQVGVFLREEQDVNRSVMDTDRMVLTGPDGTFSFDGVVPGSYQITAGFSYEQIDGWTWPVEMDDWIDVEAGGTVAYPVALTPLITLQEPVDYEEIKAEKVTFQWEEVAGAAFYELSGTIIYDGGATGIPIRTGIVEPEITLSLEELYDVRTGVVFQGDDVASVEPASILGFANVNGTFSWSVKAFDEKGHLVSQSNGYRLNEETMGSLPFFHLKERELTKADKVFLGNGDVQKALQMYKENVERDEEDVHSLRMVTRLSGLAQFHPKSLPYWISLAEKTDNPETAFEVAMYYYEQENWPAFHEWYERYDQNTQGLRKDYPASIYATALMKQGKLDEAREQFYEVLQTDHSHRFVGFLLAIEWYETEDWEEVQKLATRYKERGMQAVNWSRVWREVEEEVAASDVKAALNLFFTGTEAELDSFVQDVNKSSLARLVEMLRNIR